MQRVLTPIIPLNEDEQSDFDCGRGHFARLGHLSNGL